MTGIDSKDALAEPRAPNQSIVCILNGNAGSASARDARERLAELFARHAPHVEILIAQDGDDIADLARQAVADGCGLVVAGGGDGTINAVAAILADTPIAVGVLPLGTLNHFAKDLNIPLELEAAVETLFSGQPTFVDAGEVNGKLFLNNSSLGLYPAIVRQRDKIQKHGFGKWAAFIQATALSLWRYSHMRAAICLDGHDRTERKTPFIFVGNNRYAVAGARIGKRDRLDEGRLWIYQAPHVSRTGLLLIALRSIIGLEYQPELEIFDADAVEIRTRTARPQVSTDGEVGRLQAPLRYRIRPRALRVMVPAAQPAD